MTQDTTPETAGILTDSGPDSPADTWSLDAARDSAKRDAENVIPLWKARLQADRYGALAASLANVVDILENDERLTGIVAYDEFSGRFLRRRPAPWNDDPGEWQDLDDIELTLYLSRAYRIEPKDSTIMAAVTRVAMAHSFHEVRAYLDGLTWDGRPRLRYWLAGYLGAEGLPGTPEADYLAAIGTKWMISAVARIMRPGCKVDTVLILEGRQGALKSTAFRILGGDYFSDAPFRIGDREGYMLIRGRWIYELAELDSFNKADSNAAKLFFSQAEDRYRVPWGRRPVSVPRQTVFCGTVNHGTYLRDETGNRRYWPVKVGTIAIDELERDRDQLWAEARALFLEGAEWWPTPAERALIEDQQEARYVGDAWADKIEAWLRNEHRARASMPELLGDALGLEAGKWTRAEQIRLGAIMARLGWQRRRSPVDDSGGRPWAYHAPESWGGVERCAARAAGSHQPPGIRGGIEQEGAE